MKPQNLQIPFSLSVALLVATGLADEKGVTAAQRPKALTSQPQPVAAVPETRQNLRYTPLMGTSFSNVDALLKSKLKDWTRFDNTSTSEIGSVTYEADGVTLSLWFKSGKFSGFAIGSTATDPARSERRHREAQDALQIASDEASVSAGGDTGPATNLARFQKQHFDALIKEGFTREDALRIIALSPAPPNAGAAPTPSSPAPSRSSPEPAAPARK